MKKNSIFSQIIKLLIACVICVVVTIGIAYFVGTLSFSIFDFKNLNFSNVITFLIIGGFISCVILGFASLIIFKNLLGQIKNYLKNMNTEVK